MYSEYKQQPLTQKGFTMYPSAYTKGRFKLDNSERNKPVLHYYPQWMFSRSTFVELSFCMEPSVFKNYQGIDTVTNGSKRCQCDSSNTAGACCQNAKGLLLLLNKK